MKPSITLIAENLAEGMGRTRYLAAASLAALSYPDRNGGWPVVREKVLAMGFNDFRHVDKVTTIRDNGSRKKITPSGFIAESEHVRVHVYTGTEDARDWRTNLDDGRAPAAWGGKLQDGFADLERSLAVELPYPETKKLAIFIGHSQGAACAGISYQRYRYQFPTTTAAYIGFGSPGYQDAVSAWCYRKVRGLGDYQTYRFGRDMVSRIGQDSGSPDDAFSWRLTHLMPPIPIARTGEIGRQMTKLEYLKAIAASPSGVGDHWMAENYLGKVQAFIA